MLPHESESYPHRQERACGEMRDIVDGEKRTTRPKTIWIDSKYDTGAGGKALKSTLGKSVSRLFQQSRF